MVTDAHLRSRLRELLHDIQFGLRFRRPRISDWEQAVEILRKFGMGRDADRLERGCRSVSQGRKPTAELAEFVLSLHRCFQVNEQGDDVDRSADRPPKKTPVTAKRRNVSEKNEQAITQAIRKLPRDAPQAQVANAAKISVKTVSASVAWARRHVIWNGKAGVHAVDQDAFLDAKEATMKLKRLIDAGDKLPGFHHKTKTKLRRLMEDSKKFDRIVEHLAPVESLLAKDGQTLGDLSSEKTVAAFRYAAEAVTSQ